VVSAMGKTTDELLALARKTVKAPHKRELDMLLTAGERISMAVLAMALDELGVAAISLTGSQSGIITCDNHNDAKILDIRADRIKEGLRDGKVVIVAGYQGVSKKKEVTTLGRGGSDTTAVALAVVLKADYCEILTDVDGLYSADPKIVPNAQLLEVCSYDEALEMASLGAKMHARSIELASKHNLEVKISSSHPNGAKGTTVNLSSVESLEESKVKGIASKKGFSYFRVEADFLEVLQAARSEKFPLRFVSCADDHVRFLVETDKSEKLRNQILSLGVEFEEVENMATVSAVGVGISDSSEMLPQVFECLAKSGTECFLFSSNSLSMTVAVPESFLSVVTQKLHEQLIEI